jgi:hypothetical protein
MTPGCDKHPTRVPVSGHVLIDGEPLKYGSVIFVPDGGRSSMGVLDPQGHFTLTCYTPNDGALLGSHKVQVMASEVVDDYTTRFHAPQKYAGLATSGITKEITGPTDSVVIELTWKGDAHGKPYTQNFPRGSGANGDVESNSLFKKR